MGGTTGMGWRAAIALKAKGANLNVLEENSEKLPKSGNPRYGQH